MGAEFVTFDNAVNAMPLLCRVLYEGAAYMAVLKNFLCLFYYMRIIHRADYRAEITVIILLLSLFEQKKQTNKKQNHPPQK